MIVRSRSSRTVGSAFSVYRTGTRAGSALIAVASCARAERSFLMVPAPQLEAPHRATLLLGVVVCPLPVGLFGFDELRRDLTPLSAHLLLGGIGHAPRWIRRLHRRGRQMIQGELCLAGRSNRNGLVDNSRQTVGARVAHQFSDMLQAQVQSPGHALGAPQRNAGVHRSLLSGA